MSDLQFEGRVAVVTGAASGIGRASAEAFAAGGAKVVVADINQEGIEAVAAEIGEQAIAVVVDVADPASCQALVDKTVEAFGSLDVLFNNAGISGYPG